MDQLTLSETFAHPKEKVFAAFAQAEKLARWIAPLDEMGTNIESFDFSPEGWFQIAFEFQGDLMRLKGQFLIIDPFDRLSFSWIWQQPAPHADVESHVLVSLQQTDDGTNLTLTHSRLNAPGMLERHRAGWLGSFQRLQSEFKE